MLCLLKAITIVTKISINSSSGGSICIAKPHLGTDAIALLWMPKVLCCFSSLYFQFIF